ncbi:DUF423 domain-containing protein [Shewanella sp. YIC-542]|uniref:DUF423 domain-containing protein n=1 Tax=Shewanella mytili TaxID=3377111 RepID=UPI00398EF711
MKKGLFMLAAISGFMAVTLGAFAAHGLKTVTPPDLIAIFDIGVEYQFYHTFALIAIALAGQWVKSPLLDWAAWLFIAGIVLFSGSLYLYALLGVKVLGMITPFGGFCFLLGWALLAASMWRHRTEDL